MRTRCMGGVSSTALHAATTLRLQWWTLSGVVLLSVQASGGLAVAAVVIVMSALVRLSHAALRVKELILSFSAR